MQNFGFLLEGESGSLFPILLIVILFVVLYFFMIRPQKKQEKKDAAMRDALEVGDEVTTIGGIIGKVVSIKGETFVLETTKDKTKIRFLKGAIRTVDVKAADVAAQVIDGGRDEAAVEAKPEQAPERTSSKRKNKKNAAPAEEDTAPAIAEDENK